MRIARLLVAAAAALVAIGAPPAAADPVPQDVVVAPGTIDSATTMALAPDGRIFVAEQGGAVRVIKNGELLSTPFATLPVTSTEERGLLGIAFDPNFAVNRYVYVYYTAASPVVNRVSRLTAGASKPDVAEVGSERFIFDNIPSELGYHNGGALQFGPDGKLYFAVGENHTSDSAQDPSSLTGKLHRINADGTNRQMWALGLRNPFTFDIQPATGRIFINDVGASSYEEIDEASTSASGLNFGWPETEGPTTDSRFKTPFHYYSHSGGECAITGGAFYDPATVNFPAQFVNDYFFADFCEGWIKSIDLSTKAVSTLVAADTSRSPVDLDVAEDGSVYYLARGEGNVHRIRYVDSSSPPAISTDPQSVTVPVGGNATFSVSASGGAPLSYRWQRDGVDIPGATGSSYTLSNAQLSDDGARFHVIVSNSLGSAASDAATLTVTTDQPPAPAIDAPAAGTLYRAGDTIAYAGSATDPEDGTLGAERFTWQVDFHHADHLHPFLPAASGSTTGSFAIPNSGHTEANVWYRIHLTVRDSAGLETSTYRDVRPRTSQVSLATNVAGLRLQLDGQPVTAPNTHTGVVGMQRTIAAPSPQVVGAKVYLFTGWSDGGAQTHTIATPATATTYTATFLALPAPPGTTAAPAPLRVRLSAPRRTHRRGAWRRGIPVRVAAPPGTRVALALRRGRHRLAARTVTVDADGTRVVRLRAKVRRGRVLRIEASAAANDGQRAHVSRRIILTRG
jgi:glucose/arabinose dehydrogenase